MKSKKLLFETRTTDPEIQEFIDSTKTHPFMKKWMLNLRKQPYPLKEAVGVAGEPEAGHMVGQTYGDNADKVGTDYQVMATIEVFNAVVRGFTRYMDDSFVRKYTTDSVKFYVPLVEYQELAAGIATHELPHSEKQVDYASVDLSAPESEKGCKVSWTRALMEDATFDVQAELMEGLGHAIAVMIMKDILQTICGYHLTPTTIAAYIATLAHGDVRTISNPITWAQFLATVSDVDIGISDTSDSDWTPTTKTYGPADYVLVSTDVYWQLLNIIQLTNVLYEGSTEPINSGRIKLALGCTILKQSLLPTGYIIALNSEKAIALVTRRALKIEPVLFPVNQEPLIYIGENYEMSILR